LNTFDDNYLPEDLESGDSAVLCPVCGTRVNNNPSDSLFDVLNIDSDFRVRTLEDDILDDWLIMCPSCYYVSHDFSLTPLRENEIRNYIYSEDYVRLFPDNNPTTLELFSVHLVLLTLQGRDAYSLGDCHLRLAWLYEDEGDEENCDLHRRKAIEHFQRTLEEKAVETKQSGVLHYLIGDLHRRMGEFQKAEQRLFNLDRKEKTLKHLYEFQSKLVADKNTACVALPGVKLEEL